ncbi:glycyl-tRNA synthetase beta chain [Nitrosospira sp. Nsp11]|uniref:glycine--tRNA ligase subunit beta n=1 Tax=Nitrosospira sp. Nsp11 TaxID=1855338 RepID=UPI00091B7ABD|nr:glycine--tRNA ligase subunit beta [Nitrosospira sp. Nsp11]SHL21109.1 glycyl-tRNA synthetase beta chain [Nitrosospira sp. Nsp11]
MSNTARSVLIELLVEELPPKSLKQLGQSFGTLLFQGLQKLHNLGDGSQLTTFASPRRLAAHITNVLDIALQPPQKVKLMPVSVGVGADGEYTSAFHKKLRQSCGYRDDVHHSVLEVRISREFEGKTEFLFHTDVAVGVPVAVNVQQVLSTLITRLPIAKLMTYQLADGWTTICFVRPAHGLVALHGDETIPIGVLGLTAGRETQGHRFEAGTKAVVLRDADCYAQQLESEGAVIPGFAARRNEIVRQLNVAAAAEGLKPVEDEALLDEVTALVERPNVLVGKFESEFLDVPQECLILTMKTHQKYFPLLDANGKLSPKFLLVSNIRPADPSHVIDGNERVLRSRLADAKFFFDRDRKKKLYSRVAGLDKVVYHNKLGSQAERVERIWAIAQAIGLRLGGNELAAQAGEAAMLCKADLLTDMVGEFPELQGIMGRYYAKHDGLPDDVAFAIEDHYKPRFAGDELPRNMTGTCVALADKLEMLIGMFGIGQIPTGDKDPFALRRHALGVTRILIEKKLHIALEEMIKISSGVFNNKIKFGDTESRQLLDFIYERMSSQLREQGYSPQQIEAVIAKRPQLLMEIPQRLAAVRAFSALPEAESLAIANKRVSNILKKVEGSVSGAVNAELLQEPAERALHIALNSVMPKADVAFDRGEFSLALQELAVLKAPVDAFFDNVLVNTEDPVLRANRLALLAQLQQAMNRVADISRLVA